MSRVLFTLFAIAAVLAAPGRLRADPAPVPVAWVRSNTVLHLHQFRRGDGSVSSRRSNATRLEIAAISRPRSDGRRSSAHFSGTWAFDLGLPPDPASPLVAELQLEPTLERAFIRFEPWRPLRIDLGRNDLYSPLGLARLDGAHVVLHTPGHVTLHALAGARNAHEIARIDGFALAPDGDLAWRTTAGARPWIAELRAHLDDERWGAGAGVRTERVFGDPLDLGTTFWGHARFGRLDGWHADTELRWQTAYRLLDRARVGVQGPIADAWTSGARVEIERALFPIDSIFSVFEAPPRADAGLTFGHQRPSGTSLHVHTGTRWWAEDENSLPSFASGRALAFVRAAWAARSGPWRWRASVDSEGRDAGWDARTYVAAERRLPRMRLQGGQPYAQLASSGAVGHDARRGDGSSLGAIATFLGAGLPATDWATLQMNAGWTWDLRNGHGVRGLCVFDIRLPGGPP